MKIPTKLLSSPFRRLCLSLCVLVLSFGALRADGITNLVRVVCASDIPLFSFETLSLANAGESVRDGYLRLRRMVDAPFRCVIAGRQVSLTLVDYDPGASLGYCGAVEDGVLVLSVDNVEVARSQSHGGCSGAFRVFGWVTAYEAQVCSIEFSNTDGLAFDAAGEPPVVNCKVVPHDTPGANAQ